MRLPIPLSAIIVSVTIMLSACQHNKTAFPPTETPLEPARIPPLDIYDPDQPW